MYFSIDIDLLVHFGKESTWPRCTTVETPGNLPYRYKYRDTGAGYSAQCACCKCAPAFLLSITLSLSPFLALLYRFVITCREKVMEVQTDRLHVDWALGCRSRRRQVPRMYAFAVLSAQCACSKCAHAFCSQLISPSLPFLPFFLGFDWPRYKGTSFNESTREDYHKWEAMLWEIRFQQTK